MKIVLVGAGYVGIVSAVCLAELGHTVTCIDKDDKKINILKNGETLIYEKGLKEKIKNNKSKIKFTTDYKTAYKTARVIFICVGTPEKKDGSVNLKYIYDVVDKIAENIQNNCTIVIKSTVPIGTNDKIEKKIIKKLQHKVNINVVSNPEFLSQGSAIKDTINAHRIVLGISNEDSIKVMKKIYDGYKQPYVITDRKSAEMIKYVSNNFLALKISYINEIANLCEVVGANIDDVAKGVGMDPRIGNKFLNAGIGYGGSCFPKDTKALNWIGNFYNYELKTIKAAIEFNENQKIRLIKKARKYYNSFENLTVAILGLTFKPNTDDLREAPSLDNIPLLLEDNVNIKAYDPIGEKNFKKIYPTEIKYCSSIEETLKDADICFIFTEWDFVKKMDVSLYEKLMKKPIILDGRNCYSLEAFDGINVIYDSIGRKTINNIID